MSRTDIEILIKKDAHQVFLCVCPASMPISFASHPWFVVNKKGTISRWEIFWEPNRNKTSWGHLHKNMWPPFQGIEMFLSTKKYFWPATLVKVVEGAEGSLAHKMGEFIEASPQTYPYCYEYSFVGTNSNTYGQWILNNFPESGMRLPWNAFGKNFVRSYTGTVQQGTARAAPLGFPTANIPLEDAKVSGVYAGIVTLEGAEYPAMLYADQKHRVLEAHLLDFSGNLYGKKIAVQLLLNIRDSMTFPDDMAPAALIAEDVMKVRLYFGK